ncbi:MAG TPA: ADP-ribosylglycohydrolase family protein, partial [Candidatus Ozemobacteraceae bacterium]|nr:ADP-ribosylglycohydrolase family protein [Candidatus Ozemobacteraceae bacterium]
SSKASIHRFVSETFHYDLDRTPDQIRPTYRFDVTCSGSVPEAIVAFLHSNDYEHAVRLAVSLGGDSDTIACMTGSIAEAFYNGVPETIREQVFDRLDAHLKSMVRKFIERFPLQRTSQNE